MNLFKMFAISGAGMAAQRERMSVISGNLANTETTRTPEGGPYRRRDILFRAVPTGAEFGDLLAEDFFDRSRRFIVRRSGGHSPSRAGRRGKFLMPIIRMPTAPVMFRFRTSTSSKKWST